MQTTRLFHLLALFVLPAQAALAQVGTSFNTSTPQSLPVTVGGLSFFSADTVATLDYVGSPTLLTGTGASAVNVGIGTTTPSEALNVVGNILATGTITQNSDRRLKANVRPLTGALASVDRLRGVRYVFLPGKGPKGEQIGVIAQEVEKVYPELVRTDSRTGIKSVNYAQLTPVLLEAIKELKAELATSREALLQEQDHTTATLEALSTRLQALEAAAGSPRVGH